MNAKSFEYVSGLLNNIAVHISQLDQTMKYDEDHHKNGLPPEYEDSVMLAARHNLEQCRNALLKLLSGDNT